jgi:ribosomal protein S18 acetylase RimI-like enzyme
MADAVTNFRVANLQDAGAMAEVQVTACRESYRDLLPETMLSNLSVLERTEILQEGIQSASTNSTYLAIFVAEQEGEIVGFAGGGPCRFASLGQEMEIYAIYLLARSKRRGIGGTLLRALAADFLRQGASSAGLWVLPGNRAARSFFERFGAQCAPEKEEHRLGSDMIEIGYVWPNLSSVIAA